MSVHRYSLPPQASSAFGLYSIGLFLAVALQANLHLNAQEALRTAIQGDRAYQARLPSPARPVNELQAGPVQFNVGAAFSAEWTDNVNLSDSDPRSDISLQPQVDLGAVWPITDRARISLGLGVGYTYYLEGYRDDRLYLSPDSETALDFSIKDVLLTIYNRISYSDDPISEGGVRSESDYAQLDNTAGLRATWFLDDWQLQAGYAHYNYWSLSDDYEELDRSSEQVFARIAYALAPATRTGVEFSGSLTDYSLSTRDDYQSFSVGPFLEWTVTEHLQVTLRGGFVMYTYDDRPGGPNIGTLDSWYAGITADHQLTTAISHRLSLIREVRVGINTDYEEVFNASYGAGLNLLDPVSLRGSVFYQHSTAPDISVDENYDQFGFTIGLAYMFAPRLSANLGYRCTWRDSNLRDQDYTQNSVTLGISYRL